MSKQEMNSILQFAQQMNLMKEPFNKVQEMFNNRLPEPPAEVVINM